MFSCVLDSENLSFPKHHRLPPWVLVRFTTTRV